MGSLGILEAGPIAPNVAPCQGKNKKMTSIFLPNHFTTTPSGFVTVFAFQRSPAHFVYLQAYLHAMCFDPFGPLTS